ncbi:MAG: hypothetical protein GY909_17085 [Oligoflexia bacterium]|nr:hypothetical protein [Oligoflexia bacterium]
MSQFLKLMSIVSLVITVSVEAKLDTTKYKNYFSWTTSKEMPKAIKDARKRRVSRSFASSDVDLSLMSAEYKQMRDKVINASSADELHKMIIDVEGKMDKLPADAKFLASVLVTLKPFRGIVYRMIPMVEKPRITHSFLRNQVKSMASNMRVYLPTEHWEAGFAYITQPYMKKNGEVVEQFTKPGMFAKDKRSATEKFQEHISTEVYAAIAQSARTIQDIKFEKPIVWDNKLVFGPESFQDEINENRYRYMQEGERRLALSSLHFGLHYITFFSAYDIEGSLKLSKDIGKLYGVDGFLGGPDSREGAPSYKVVKQVKKYKNLYTIRDGGANFMDLSFRHLTEGVRQLRLAREEVRNEAPGRLFVINAARVDPWDENFEKTMANIECAVEDVEGSSKVCSVRSAITSEVVKVDLRNFYMNPPSDLKSFMPIGWNTSKTKIKDKKLGVTYPNYFWGHPTKWDGSAYAPYFPEANTNSDMRKYARVLRQGWGGEMFGAPIAMFVE